MNFTSHRFTRQQLYDLVWESPITSVAKTIGVSDVAVSKACKKTDIPIPPRGYWAKLQACKQVISIQLGHRGFGKSDVIHIGDHYARHTIDLDADLPNPPSYTETPQEVITRAQLAVKGNSFPKTLTNPHYLVAAVLKEDEVRRAELLASPYYWKKPVFETPEAKRKLKILNAIFTVMARMGEKPYLKSNDHMEAGVIVGEMHIPLAFESLKQKKRPLGDDKPPRTKVDLKLTIEHHGSTPEYQTTWEDKDNAPLESQIAEISAGLLVSGEMLYRSQAQRSYDWLVERKVWHEEEKRKELERKERERLEQLLMLERKKRRQLLADIHGWRRADEIRAFIAAVNARKDLEDRHESKQKLDRWSAWALNKADQMDPLRRPIEEMMDYFWQA